MRTDGSIYGLAALLGKAGLVLGAEEMADALWLAGYISPGVKEQVVEEEDIETKPAAPKVREEYLDSEPEDDEDDAQLPLSLPQKQDGIESGSAKSDGIPIKVPAAPAMRIRQDLARALRPLRRRVPSYVRMKFDQAATIERIADQGIWSPVSSPAPERWLEVALVIEESKSAPLWKETLAEFQTLLERQGAFRAVSPWRLKSDETGELTLSSGQSSRPRSARELLDPAGRRLILLLSDCTSATWQRGTIYPWLETWGEQAPMTVIQLLPERLWVQTGLAHGVPAWLSSLEPGVPSARMIVTAQMPLWDLFGLGQEQVTVPIVSLEAEPLKQWARVIAGDGESRTTGFLFEKKEDLEDRNQNSEEQPELNTEERVKLFRATASMTAQKLAGLMAAAPVSPSIVNLIRQTLLPEAKPVHVAEVYMGGLIEVQRDREYDFILDVRDILLDTISATSIEQVLDTISGYISERLNLNTRSFEALLSINFEGNAEVKGMVVPFARVAEQTLRRMGREYAVVVDRIRVQPKVPVPFAKEDPSDWVPLLQTFTFREATVKLLKEKKITDEVDLNSVLDYVNYAVFKYSDRYLSHVEIEIARFSWEGLSYQQMARRMGYATSSIRSYGYSFWKLMSHVWPDTKVTKVNFREIAQHQYEEWIHRQSQTSLE